MKNDVVRWSRQPIATIIRKTTTTAGTTISNRKNSNNKQRISQEKLWQDVARTNCQLQQNELQTYVAATLDSGWQQHQQQQQQQQLEQQQQQQQQTIIKCDIRKNFNLNCNLFKTSFLTKNNNSRHSKITKTPPATRTSTSTSTPTSTSTLTAALLLILQFSAVVFLCNFNVGFVAGSVSSSSSSSSSAAAASSFKLEAGQSQSSPSSSPVLPPYVLDYETGSGSGKLTPSNTRNGNTAGHYTHTWAVHIPNGDNGIADAVAKDHGFVNLGKILDDHYHFAHHKVSKRSLSPATHHQTRLDFDERVHWAKQQRAKSRSKRDFIQMRPSRTSSRATSLIEIMGFDDAKWPQMWYLNRGPGLDMNVIPAWRQGITGKGVVVTILDDGLESDHPDIEQNYDPRASYDVNSHDDDPMPHYDLTDSNRHGTRCAGEVAATANNTICAVGIAYEASVGGVRMLDGDVTDAVEARSLSLNPQHIDIYSASWGPDDDGKTVDGPGELASRAFIEGTTKGRSGKGSIFIWASGNGGREQDNCNCDGYTNSIWTLSISSATEEGHVPWYSEKCSSTLATTYSSGGQSEKQVVTTDLHHACTVSHTGTSASAPLAAGIAALVLQSNQNLTWRDLQHIVVRTAKPANLKDSTWIRNGVGRRVSHSFGYGLMDASDMVRVAKTWKTVPEQQRCEINAPHVDKVIPPRNYITLQLSVKHCHSVNYLEHVQAKITLTSQRRGDIQLYLKSPANTKVTLLTSRIHDNSRSGFNQWPFMSVHTWGESPHGNWQLEIHNEGRYMGHALLREWSLIFYGTTQSIDPNDPISVPRTNSAEATTPNTSSSGTTRNLHQIYSAQYPRISSNNFGNTPSGGAKLPVGKMPPNKLSFVTNNPLLNPMPVPPKQGYQQISATYGVILGKANNKGNNKSNNKSNKANKQEGGNQKGQGKGNKHKEQIQTQSTTTSTTASSTTTSRNKYYRISQQQQGKANKQDKNGLQTARPKANSGEKSNEEKPRKVIGDISASNNRSGNNTRPAIKAAKQIKDSSSSSSSSSSSGSTDSRIPKLFERYEKIQAIFPELQPYEGSSSSSSSSVSSKPKMSNPPRKQGKQFEVELFKPTTGGNSKQGNTKKSPSVPPPSQAQTQTETQSLPALPAGGSSFLPDQKILKKQQLLMAAAGVMTPIEVVEEARHEEGENEEDEEEEEEVDDDNIEVLAPLPPPVGGTKKGNGPNAQITQWDMIFYGTETPAQPEDKPNEHNEEPNQFLFGNDMAHNDIEYDASGQWRNMQQVGEVGMTRDRSNTAACLKWSDQKCLECKDPTYFFEGLCYDECPQHTYSYDGEETVDDADEEENDESIITTESPTISSSVTLSPLAMGLATDHPLIAAVSNSVNDKDDPLQAEDRRRRRDTSALTPLTLAQRHICVICDKSCLNCYGPLASQCSTCYPGSQLRKEANETFCYAYVVRSTGLGTVVDVSNLDGESSNSSRMQNMSWTTTLLVIAVVISLIGVILAGGMAYNRRAANATRSSDQLYTRVALMADESDDDGEAGEEEIFTTRILGPPKAHLDYRDELKVPTKLLTEEDEDEGEAEE